MSETARTLKQTLDEKRKDLNEVWKKMPPNMSEFKVWNEWQHEELLASQEEQTAKLNFEHQLYLDRGDI
jgi:hypothetical protein